MEEKLKSLFDLILEEAENNQDFKNKLDKVLDKSNPKKKCIKPRINPFEMIKAGEGELREALDDFSISELKDIIRFYGMDELNETSRWRKKERLINYILDSTLIMGRNKKIIRIRE